MSDNYWEEYDEREEKERREHIQRLVEKRKKEFEGLTLEEKIDKLIEKYVYNFKGDNYYN